MDPKPVSASQVTVSQLMMPQDANPSGNVHGGVVLRIIDQAAAAAMRHCRQRVVTARQDDMSFLKPVSLGNLLTVKASVNDVGSTSLEVGVRVEAEDLATGETWHVAAAYLVFVALDEQGTPVAVPALLAETPTEQRRQREAKRRRRLRQQHQEELALMRAEEARDDPGGCPVGSKASEYGIPTRQGGGLKRGRVERRVRFRVTPDSTGPRRADDSVPAPVRFLEHVSRNGSEAGTESSALRGRCFA